MLYNLPKNAHIQILILYFLTLQRKYRQKYEQGKGHYIPVLDTPQILHAKSVRILASEVRTVHASLNYCN